MPGATHAGSGDAWTARFAADGSRLWLEQFGTTANDQVSGLVTRSDGSVAAVGHTRDALEGESVGDNDVFVRAFDPEGAALWTTQTGTSTDDRGIAGGKFLGVGPTNFVTGGRNNRTVGASEW